MYDVPYYYMYLTITLPLPYHYITITLPLPYHYQGGVANPVRFAYPVGAADRSGKVSLLPITGSSLR